MLDNKNVVLGVTGGIAAYKACDLTSKLVQQGAHVKVIMTNSAMEFVSPLTFQALSRNPVYTDTFDEKDPENIAHIELADWAHIVMIAPATANFIGKLANGIGNDMLTTTLLATKAPIYIAPAMNVNMYDHPAVKQNMNTLTERGNYFIEPQAGYLACGWIGKGRLEEPQSIIDSVSKHLQQASLLVGKKILISAGPTREKVDPVRFFTNRSSGKMGYAFAEAAAQLGAEVTLVSGPVDLVIHHPNVQRIDVTTAEEMYQAMHHYFPKTDIVVKTAAVADYRPKNVYDEKMKKQPGDMHLEMIRTKDILQSLGEEKQHQFLAGFAAETENHIESAIGKLEKKNLDAIIVNNVKMDGVGFAGDTNAVTYINKTLDHTEIPLASKKDVAEQVLKLIVRDLKQGDA
ncbi:bifunctional phosphopantothenoylcysteine decarboxylase/phosphopantothenate--cysteine ligase CoaBC [Virgibacillus sp. W0181]|uniref:bifunctional phosphopantothenoylcysteine decarboxylase/phosphopantothenate--cysteine ligase CoaBC n=1 Tax=Virgibacillus sp. W0181 TaxID=3391581 RepID=UPI003F45A7C3